MKFKASLLVVRDAQASKRFYQDMMHAEVMLDLGDYVYFRDGFCLQQEETWLEFIGEENGPVVYGGRAGELFFEEDDIDAFLEHFSSFPDIKVLNPLREYPWGQRAMRFYDPDGHVVEVGESMEVVVKRYLKAGDSVEEVARKSMFPVSFVEMCLAEMKE